MKPAIICDLDGTLCNISHRLHFINNDLRSVKKDWNSFYYNMPNDTVNIWCLTIIDALLTKGIDILYVTGRPDEYKSITVDWLRRNNCPINGIYMRPFGDNRPDSIVKKEIYETEIKNKYNVLFVIEDRMSVTKMWRDIGLTCLQCAEGLY